MTRLIQPEIENIKSHIGEIGTLIEENLQRAVKALLTRDSDLAREVIRLDKEEIDRQEIELEEACLRIMARHQPVAGDLRFLVTVLKVNGDLERIGDLSAKIADKVLQIETLGPGSLESNGLMLPEMLQAMYNKTLKMLRQTMAAFLNGDIDLAYKVCLTDDEVDTDKRAIREELEVIIARNPAQHVYLAKLLGVARSLERIADHCTNICEDVIYMAQGEIVRHQPLH
ncbi:phosphate signaling complex protein PhoU [Desulfurivibrio alkaliphilus]|uniref:Phosphate-specific transport system accessory protein PhoU n=1 Tax=Desulfurivibrio alkaliphilus (strain DSM 19089 / UNIQEM U267 / AHT2) TaxID=589865 RepID=D6Z3Y9_DESAT|nr:phosphate signaling complex protein PhoU [Desulfurivibrio alkaliphilus]ADH86264.1 phosphate uptake regulator, PhoU [Desulfurivibrio alkaliphilus AHT 2]